MFDPSIYENLKVVIEGHLYDLDLTKKLVIVSRKDLVDLANLSRTFSLSFQLNESFPRTTAEIVLHSTLKDFADEKMERDEVHAGCELQIYFYSAISSESDCKNIEERLQEVWSHRPTIQQEIHYKLDQRESLRLKVNLLFNRKINEAQIEDLAEMIELCVTSLHLFS